MNGTFKTTTALHCTPASTVHPEKSAEKVGEAFLKALAEQDFSRLESLYKPQVRFRAMVPSGERVGQTAEEAVKYLRRWFGSKDTLQVLESATRQVSSRQYLSYQLRLHDNTDGWQVIEQHAYYNVQDGQIADMWLACSGFLPDPDHDAQGMGSDAIQTQQPALGGDVFYDAGSKGCAEGPMDDIAGLLRPMAPGQTLEIHATDPSVKADLSAWCRLSGHTLVKQSGEYYLIQHK